ncbi:DNA-binding ferritin-like protein [Chryseobacterium ginsenosidimutans]|uniref:ferritin-like domain-containing protein n=1 Tax=Chryseobacterium ginsenosidimutans TaxID=687846 RepID=UPI0027839567|nr:ferritin-like domain-containing protein [Chryseobacterium ginsenosidimutans]MDQ0595004.1 DNA-binding ferritin-like protein [Chryseobacterium ginsenosidimutans]
MKSKTEIQEAKSQAVADELIRILADESLLYIKSKNAHWNIEGPDFYDKHVFFESQYVQLDK